MESYGEFLDRKSQYYNMFGFEPVFMPDYLMDFQKSLVEWACRRGRAAIFADCGLGKTIMALVWAENVIRKTNGKILILTPLAVGLQTIRESVKFGIESERSKEGGVHKNIVITNYERLHYFNPDDFVGCICDESSILKNFDGKYKADITEFMRKMSYRLLCTATAAPNDYIELGTSSEALGELGFMDMLNRFFKNDQNPTSDTKRHWARTGGVAPKWRFKKHAENPFWRWVCSWARAVRRPSDLGFDDGKFILPDLKIVPHITKARTLPDGMLFDLPAIGLAEQRAERKRTINERCEMAAEVVKNHDYSISWCYLNNEANLLEKMIPDSVQVCGSQSDDEKEEALLAFINGDIKKLITKPMCAGFGLNLQHCAHMTFFPSHSYEQYYQSVRRCWRFGQTRPVTVDIITTEGGKLVIDNLQRKADAADKMFDKLVLCMNDALALKTSEPRHTEEEIPEWLSTIK